MPVAVTYELTDAGRSLYATVCDLRAWAQDTVDEVIANRAHDDARL